MLETLLCDMGGILVHFNKEAFAQGLAKLLKPLPYELVHGFVTGGKSMKILEALEAGRINEEQYLTEFDHFFDRRIPRKAYWTSVHTGRETVSVNHEALELLRRIKGKNKSMRIALVSNVDPVMLKYCVDSMDFDFDHVVPSFRVKSCKPDAAIYKTALVETSTMAPNAMFWDDRAENVRAAKDLSICAYRFTDLPAMERILTGFNLI